jgi:hypothetical protein
MANTHKCAHPGCKCQVEHFGEYCSDECRKAGDAVESKCHCNHPACTH